MGIGKMETFNSLETRNDKNKYMHDGISKKARLEMLKVAINKLCLMLCDFEETRNYIEFVEFGESKSAAIWRDMEETLKKMIDDCDAEIKKSRWWGINNGENEQR